MYNPIFRVLKTNKSKTVTKLKLQNVKLQTIPIPIKLLGFMLKKGQDIGPNNIVEQYVHVWFACPSRTFPANMVLVILMFFSDQCLTPDLGPNSRPIVPARSFFHWECPSSWSIPQVWASLGLWTAPLETLSLHNFLTDQA